MTNHQQDAQVFNWHYTELDNHNLEVRSRKVLFIIFLFCLILIMILLFLCARWICRYRDRLPVTFHSSQVRHAPSPPSQGLDLDAIKKLPIILHQVPSETASDLIEGCSAFRTHWSVWCSVLLHPVVVPRLLTYLYEGICRGFIVDDRELLCDATVTRRVVNMIVLGGAIQWGCIVVSASV